MPQKQHATQKASTRTEHAKGDLWSLTFMHPKVPQESSGIKVEENLVTDKQHLCEEKEHICDVRGAKVLSPKVAPLQQYNGFVSRGVYCVVTCLPA